MKSKCLRGGVRACLSLLVAAASVMSCVAQSGGQDGRPAATRNPAEYLKKLDEFWTVEVGKRADLLLVEADPLESVANLQRRAGVMVRGRWLPESELRRMLAEVAALHGAPPQ